MIDLGVLKIGVTADNTEANKNLDETSAKASKLSKVGNITKASVKGVAKGMVALGTATATAGTAIFGMATKTSQAQDRIDKMSQSLGMSKKGFQEWDYILGQNGASIDGMKMAMKTLVSDTTATNEAFDTLGLTITDSMSQEEIFEKTVTALQGMEDGTAKAQLATDLFGRQAQDLMPLLNSTAESTAQLRQQANDLGFVMSDEAVSAGAKFSDTLDNLKKSVSGVANNMISDFMPSITEGMEAFTGFITGAEGADEALSECIDSFISQVNDKLPEFIKKGSEIILKIVAGITKALPQLLKGAMQIIPTITKQILKMLPQLIDTAMQLIVTLAQGIVQALPELIPQIVNVVTQIVNTLLNNIGMLIDAGIQILLGLTQGIIQALPQLIDQIPTIIDNIITVITENLPLILQAGITILIELTKGIIKAIPDLVSKIPQIITSIVKGFANYYSKIFNIGKDLVMQIWEGIKSIGDWISDKFSGLFGDMFDKLPDLLKAPLNGVLGLINLLIDGINVMIRGINKISFDIPDWDWLPDNVQGKSLGFNIKEIKRIEYFADGGILTQPTTFGFIGNTQLVGGEAGAEAIIPLDKLPELMAKIQGNNKNITINQTFNSPKPLNRLETIRQSKNALTSVLMGV